MEALNTWRFPGNNHTTEQGLDTADMETFKKDAMSSLARELCQNSVDARIPGSKKPVKIVFKSFEISKDDIPQRDLLVKQIHACKDTWTNSKKITSALTNMDNQINKDSITCLRISDFNTTGLVGVCTGGDDTPWHYLVHGSGLSEKSETSGGSKGIGKFATFVASYFNTVFYSTKTITNEEGHEGICKLCSAKQEGTNEKTLGIGYFGSDDENKPIEGQLSLDKSFKRKESGTDIYVLGFKNEINWQKNIISKTLESFIVAIAFGDLEVEVDGISINKDTLKEVVFNDELIKKEHKKSIVSQYLLLTSPDRKEDVVQIEGYGNAKLYLLELDDDYEQYATNKVVMIRYPYMKIKDSQKVTTIPCSAMCIIGNDNLNKVLRNVENPQHTDWEFNRIEDETEKQKIRNLYYDLMTSIQRIIADHLSSSDNTTTDLEGAGDYLPGYDDQPAKRTEEEKKVVKENPTHHPELRVKNSNPNASIDSEVGDGISLFVGGDETEELLTPDGQNESKKGSTHPGETPKEGGIGENGPIVAKHAQLRSMQYRMVCINKKQGKYVVIFTSDFNEPESTLYLFSLDEGGNRYPVVVNEASVNGEKAELDTNNGVKLSLEHSKKYKVEMTTNQTELFSGEVKIYAYR